jgi:radical SAM-linked protein
MLRRAGLPFRLTGGFHPTPRWVFALSLPLGVVGRNEVVELELDTPHDPDDVLSRLREQAPAGFAFHRCDVVPLKATAVPRRAVYTLQLGGDAHGRASVGAREAVSDLLAQDQVWLDKSHPRPRRVNVRPYIRGLAVTAEAVTLDLWVTGQGTVRADDLLRRLGLADALAAGAVLERTHLEIIDEVPDAADRPPAGPPDTLPLSHAPATAAGDDPHPAPTAGTWGLSPAGPVVE